MAKKQGKIIFQDQVFSGDRWIDNYRKNSVSRLSIILSKHLLTRKWSFGFENFLKIKTFFPTKNIFNHFKANESFVVGQSRKAAVKMYWQATAWGKTNNSAVFQLELTIPGQVSSIITVVVGQVVSNLHQLAFIWTLISTFLLKAVK